MNHGIPGPPCGLSLAIRNAQLDAHNAAMLAQFDHEADIPDTTITGATAGGDEQKLRGIPAIGRGCAGAIRGTSPHHAARWLHT